MELRTGWYHYLDWMIYEDIGKHHYSPLTLHNQNHILCILLGFLWECYQVLNLNANMLDFEGLIKMLSTFGIRIGVFVRASIHSWSIKIDFLAYRMAWQKYMNHFHSLHRKNDLSITWWNLNGLFSLLQPTFQCFIKTILIFQILSSRRMFYRLFYSYISQPTQNYPILSSSLFQIHLLFFSPISVPFSFFIYIIV